MIDVSNKNQIGELDNNECMHCGSGILFVKDHSFENQGRVYTVRECEDCGLNNLSLNVA